MNRNIYRVALVVCCLFLPMQLQAQLTEEGGERLIRVAEVGELADSINVWGSVGASGRYIVPEGTSLPKLISYSFGYTMDRGGTRESDFSKTLIEVKVSRYIEDRQKVEVAYFRYKFHEPEPPEMFKFDLQNNDIVNVQVKSRPTFGDYVGVVAPVVSVIATSILLLENLRGE